MPWPAAVFDMSTATGLRAGDVLSGGSLPRGAGPAAMPGREESTLLDLPAGTPVLRWVRTGFTERRPVRVSVSTFAGDRNKLGYTLGDAGVIARFVTGEADR